MSIKHWKLVSLKGSERVLLFATTTDRMVEHDLEQEANFSLIQTARQYHRRGQTSDQNHRDLAIAAFMAYAPRPAYDLSFEHIEAAQEVPEGPPTCYVASANEYPLVPVWEREASDDGGR